MITKETIAKNLAEYHQLFYKDGFMTKEAWQATYNAYKCLVSAEEWKEIVGIVKKQIKS